MGSVPSFSLAGRVAIVTGGSRGIGRNLAECFAAAGADVVIASRKLDVCTVVADEIAERQGVRALAVAYHAGRWQDAEDLRDRVYSKLGRCDILVNNAGMSPVYGGDLLNITEEYYDKVSAVNLRGPFRLGSLVGARMKADGGGSIINIGAVGSLRPGKDELVYACAKAGLNALTIGLAGAYAPTVRANCLLPGAVDTDIARGWDEKTRRQAIEGTLAGRLGTPGDLAGAALWLASDASTWVTGSLIRVDGGAYAQL